MVTDGTERLRVAGTSAGRSCGQPNGAGRFWGSTAGRTFLLFGRPGRSSFGARDRKGWLPELTTPTASVLAEDQIAAPR
jgi:hypothetical protein